MRARSQDAARNADAAQVEGGGVVEVVENMALIDPVQGDVPIGEVDQITCDVDDHRGTSRCIDGDAASGVEVGGADGEAVESCIRAGEHEISPCQGIVAVGALADECIGEISKLCLGGGEVDETALGGRAIDEVDTSQRGGSSIESTALVDGGTVDGKVATYYE